MRVYESLFFMIQIFIFSNSSLALNTALLVTKIFIKFLNDQNLFQKLFISNPYIIFLTILL